jgi:hypothetical protein
MSTCSSLGLDISNLRKARCTRSSKQYYIHAQVPLDELVFIQLC